MNLFISYILDYFKNKEEHFWHNPLFIFAKLKPGDAILKVWKYGSNKKYFELHSRMTINL